MSTRCSVKLKHQKGHFADTQIYHHWDGYPENMVDLLATAWRTWLERKPFHTANKILNHVLAADPDGYELEEYGTEHGDWEYLYTVTVHEDSWNILVESMGVSERRPSGIVILDPKGCTADMPGLGLDPRTGETSWAADARKEAEAEEKPV